jgi:hypothetical protein
MCLLPLTPILSRKRARELAEQDADISRYLNIPSPASGLSLIHKSLAYMLGIFLNFSGL